MDGYLVWEIRPGPAKAHIGTYSILKPSITLVIWEKQAEMTHPKLSKSDQSSRRYENRIGMFVRGRTLQSYEVGSGTPCDMLFISGGIIPILIFSVFEVDDPAEDLSACP